MDSREVYKAKGLSDEEIDEVQSWIEAGKPGLAQSKAAELSGYYMYGMSIHDIMQVFPGYSRALLNWARVEFDWDGIKEAFCKGLKEEVVEQALTAQRHANKAISQMWHPISQQLEVEYRAYMRDPSKQPTIFPQNVKELKLLKEMLDQLVSNVTESLGEKAPTNKPPQAEEPAQAGVRPPDNVHQLSSKDRLIARMKAREEDKNRK